MVWVSGDIVWVKVCSAFFIFTLHTLPLEIYLVYPQKTALYSRLIHTLSTPGGKEGEIGHFHP